MRPGEVVAVEHDAQGQPLGTVTTLGAGSENARITGQLLAGDYWVQVRHYNRATGMGNYTVKVRKA